MTPPGPDDTDTAALQRVLSSLEEAHAHAARASTRLQAMRDMSARLVDVLDDILLPINLHAEILQARASAADRPAWLALSRARQRADSLVDALRAFGERLQPRTTPFDPAPLLQRVCARHRARLPVGVHLSEAGRPAIAGLNADAELIEHALDLIVELATDRCGDDGSISVRTRVHRLDGSEAGRLRLARGPVLHIEIADDAAVTPESPASLAGEPFAPSPLGARMGMSLAAAGGIARAHGGCLVATPGASGGLQVHLFLPLLASPATTEGPSAAPPATGARVLVVDDDRLVSFSIVRLLEAAGYTTTIADTGAEALQRLEGDTPRAGLVLLDLKLPDMTGEQCLRTLRERHGSVPVICMSGLPVPHGHPIQAMPPVRVLEKPFLAAELIAMIAELLPGGAPAEHGGPRPRPATEQTGRA